MDASNPTRKTKGWNPYPTTYPWRPPATIKEQMEEKARENGRSLNQELTRAAMEWLRPRYRT